MQAVAGFTKGRPADSKCPPDFPFGKKSTLADGSQQDRPLDGVVRPFGEGGSGGRRLLFSGHGVRLLAESTGAHGCALATAISSHIRSRGRHETLVSARSVKWSIDATEE